MTNASVNFKEVSKNLIQCYEGSVYLGDLFKYKDAWSWSPAKDLYQQHTIQSILDKLIELKG